ncbi:MAG: hypothetical protein O8C66_10730 [Candidatus Methanoperedens sp.]|nr:hypothetical protein [Candidatus Methanoperedens sp.]MCZ7370972.1 hypothetical protein [Candidatus Methanoperedens sp.]
MDAKDVGLAGVMVLSSIVLTYKWLTRLGHDYDPVILMAAMLLIGSLAMMILLLNTRVRVLEESLNAKERSIRINIKGVEENLGRKIEDVSNKTSNTIGEFSKRIYR